MDITDDPSDREEETLAEQLLICKKEDTNSSDETTLEDPEIEDKGEILIPNKLETADDLIPEEEWQIDEDIQPCPEINEESEQEDLSTKVNDKINKGHNLMFEDRELSEADMFVCNRCHRVFAGKYKLMSHQSRVHGFKKRGRPMKKPRRRINGQEEDWPPNVQRLARRVNGAKMFFCDQCSYNVKRCDSMTKHITRVHSKGRLVPQYMCEVCGKTFVDKAYLRNHGLSHVTDRLYKCEICERSFHRQPSLKRHVQTHSDEKQFACSLCEYKTNRKHLMYNHAENHRIGRAYTCKVCSAKFFTQISLRKHVYTHNISRNSCSFCEIGFSSRERMWCHMQKVHFNCEVKELNTGDSETHSEVKVEYIEVKVEPFK